MGAETLLVIAKEPVAGRVKTRLCPPCSPQQAADLAGAALLDTLDAVARTPARRRVLVFEGDGARWCPPGFELLAQRGDGLAERLGNAFEDAGAPALLVGMDTPQLTPRLLRTALDTLSEPGVDAVLGPALDGGYWSIGLCTPRADVFDQVPMSEAHTCEAQRARLAALDLSHVEQPALRDVDTIVDARAVAALAPGTRFAAAVAAL